MSQYAQLKIRQGPRFGKRQQPQIASPSNRIHKSPPSSGMLLGLFSSVQFASATGKRSAMKVIGIIPARYASTRFPASPWP